MGLEIDLTKALSNMDKAASLIIDDAAVAIEAACLNVVAEARELDTYTDQTCNLRSSIGYAVYKDGVKTSENYEKRTDRSKTGIADGDTGVASAEKKATEIVALERKARTGAVIVAGMPYAAAVESKGYDVVTGPAQRFGKYFKEYMEEIAK